MFGRLQVLLNGLKAPGHTFTKAQINLKILDNFPKVWEPKTITIQETRNLKTLAWDELLGNLIVHEIHLQNRDHLPKKDFVALKSGETSSRREENKSFSKAFKVQMTESNGSYNSSRESTDDEVALMCKKLRQMMKNKGNFQHCSRRNDTRCKKKYKEESNEIIYFEC